MSLTIEELLTELNESKLNRKIYTFPNSEEAYNCRQNWYNGAKRRNITNKLVMEKRENQLLCYYVGTDFIEPVIMKPQKEKKPVERCAYLDKHATKVLPGTMEQLRQIANEASDNHMSYGKYVAKVGIR